MKKLLSIILAAVIAASAVSCTAAPTDTLLTSTSSATYADEAWLSSRLGEIPDNVTVGTADVLGIDMTDFESDGYFIRTSDGETVVCGKTADGLDRAVRKYARAYETGEVADTTYHEGYRIKDLRIADNPISDYTIVVPEDHHPNIDFAARELTRLIEKGTGVKLPTAVGTADGYKIVFSVSDDEALEEDGYVYEVKGGDLLISGAYERGCSNAVWRFLENELGWTNLTYGDSCLTPADLVDIPEGCTRTETPAFSYLNMYRDFWGTIKNEKASMTSAESTKAVLANCCHGMQANKFAGEEVDAAWSQMCCTDDYQYEIFLENVTAFIEKKLAGGAVIGKDFLAVDIAQGDNEGWCGCKECRNMMKTVGNQAGLVVYCANRLCEDLEDVYPGLLFQIFAYMSTKIPPKNIIPHKNIRVTFCYDFNCSNHKLDGTECGDNTLSINGKNNATYDEYVTGWSEITDHIAVWFYALDTVLLQYSVINNIYDDFRYFRDRNVDIVFWQCQFDGTGIQRVEHQLLAELNWNMDMSRDDFEALLCRILEKEYGPEWENIREYIRMWEASQDLVPCWHCWGWTQTAWDSRFDVGYVERNYDQFVFLFDDAIRNAASAAEQERLENLSCSMLYTGFYASYFRAEANGDTERMKVLSDRYDVMIERLYRNGFDPCGGGMYTVDGARVVFPRTGAELAEEIREEVGKNLVNGYSGRDHAFK